MKRTALRLELFDEFFDSGMQESVSPFLTPGSRKFARSLGLKAALLAAVLLALSFLFSFFPKERAISDLFLLFSFILVGTPALIASLEDLLNMEINIDILMTLGAFLAIPIGSGKEGALLLVLFALSGAMEGHVEKRATSALTALKKISPTRAYVLDEKGDLFEQPIAEVGVGEKILVKAGEIVPLDGKVVSGSSSVNLTHLTGESLPMVVSLGDEIAAGAQNLEGTLTIEVARTNRDSTLARLISEIKEAEALKPGVERFFDRFSHRYAITIILLASATALLLPLFMATSYLGRSGSIYRALAFLIAASPCALIIATPIAYLSAISCCAKRGIMLKGGIVLDALSSCKALALDKTGTLTEGQLSCVGIELVGIEDEQRVLSIAYTLERNVVHPIARSITQLAVQRAAVVCEMVDFRSVAGFGLAALIAGKRCYIGNRDFIMPLLAVSTLPLAEQKRIADRLADYEQYNEALSLLYIETEGVALFRFRDQLRSGVHKTLTELKERFGLKLWMLTGDHERAAATIAASLPLDGFFADLRPGDKMRRVAALAKEQNLAMLGDGINDAPALARAHVGISMGKIGSRTAIDASDIILLQDNLELLPWLFTKAKLTQQIVMQNLSFALAIIMATTVLALIGWVPLWLAVSLHEGGTIVVGLNALRLLKPNL